MGCLGPYDGLKFWIGLKLFDQFSFISDLTEMGEIWWNSGLSGRIPEPCRSHDSWGGCPPVGMAGAWLGVWGGQGRSQEPAPACLKCSALARPFPWPPAESRSSDCDEPRWLADSPRQSATRPRGSPMPVPGALADMACVLSLSAVGSSPVASGNQPQWQQLTAVTAIKTQSHS
jgi:hypothetical protein